MYLLFQFVRKSDSRLVSWQPVVDHRAARVGRGFDDAVFGEDNRVAVHSHVPDVAAEEDMHACLCPDVLLSAVQCVLQTRFALGDLADIGVVYIIWLGPGS